MKMFQLRTITIRSSFITACLVSLVSHCHGAMFRLPSGNEAVERAVTAANLRTAAASTTDPDVWLGLSLFPQPGDPVRQELSEQAVKAKPEYSVMAILLANAMDGVDEQSANELIRRDPDNALGYYLLGNRLFKPGGEKDSLDALRKGTACPELRLYGQETSNVLFKALDAVNLKGRDRLCASAWMEARWENFEIGNLQSQGNVLRELAKNADIETRKEISDLMLALAGHLLDGNLMTRTFGERDLVEAFRLKAEIAASEKSPTMDGYAGVVRALVSTKVSWPGFKRQDPLELATFGASRFWLASTFAVASTPESKCKAAATALINAALPDQDEIIGAYFCGHLPPRANAPAPWSASPTYVERLIPAKPFLFAALAAYEDARLTLNDEHDSAAPIVPGSPAPEPAITARDECIATLRRIDSAKQQWALEMGKQAADTPIWKDLLPYLGRAATGESAPDAELPKCPSGGDYTIGTVGEKPKCTIAGHVLW